MTRTVPRAALYRTRIRHVRTEPLRNEFTYGHEMWRVDLDDLPQLPAPLGALLRFEARDHLGDPGGTIRANLDDWLDRQGVDRPERVVLLTNPRWLGHVFNPISVYWCFGATDRLSCIVAEVHNTYGERHCYLLRPDADGRAAVGKEFYVSPFFPVDGEYDMRFTLPEEHVAMSMTLRRHGRAVFVAGLRGERRPATTGQVLLSLARFPLGALRVSALIRWQGIRLYLRHLSVIPRPPHEAQDGVQ